MASTRENRHPGPGRIPRTQERIPRRSAPHSRDRSKEFEESEEETSKEPLKKRVWKESKSFIFDFIGAMIVLLIIIGALFTYTGNWPPLVVVQSGSMQHSSESSSLGTIDTGDLVFVKKLSDDESPITYVEGVDKDYRKYGSYGDVIIFRPNGNESRTAIIHRAAIWIEFNSSSYNNETRDGGGYNVPSLGLRNIVTTFTIEKYEWPKRPESRDEIVDVRTILNRFKSLGMAPHSGYLTKGDDNDHVDQTSSFGGAEPAWIKPVKKEWIIGKSVGELPWFGIIKLKLENNGDSERDIHSNSERNLWIALIVIVASPFVIDFGIHFIIRTVRKGKEEDKEEEEEPEETVRPPRRRSPPKSKDYIDLDEGERPTPQRRSVRAPRGGPPPRRPQRAAPPPRKK
jgi:signal peptidase